MRSTNLAATLTDQGNAEAALPPPSGSQTAAGQSRHSRYEAVGALDHTRAWSPTVAKALYRLAVAQRAAGDDAAARGSLRRALAISGAFKDAAAAKTLTAKLGRG